MVVGKVNKPWQQSHISLMRKHFYVILSFQASTVKELFLSIFISFLESLEGHCHAELSHQLVQADASDSD